jgi:hypothetical protein
MPFITLMFGSILSTPHSVYSTLEVRRIRADDMATIWGSPKMSTFIFGPASIGNLTVCAAEHMEAKLHAETTISMAVGAEM